MKEDEVVMLMASSNSDTEWKENCKKVLNAYGGEYPLFWYRAIILNDVIGRDTHTQGFNPNIKLNNDF